MKIILAFVALILLGMFAVEHFSFHGVTEVSVTQVDSASMKNSSNILEINSETIMDLVHGIPKWHFAQEICPAPSAIRLDWRVSSVDGYSVFVYEILQSNQVTFREIHLVERATAETNIFLSSHDLNYLTSELEGKANLVEPDTLMVQFELVEGIEDFELFLDECSNNLDAKIDAALYRINSQ